MKEAGNEISIKPRGKRAETFFRSINELTNNQLPKELSFQKEIDFFINSKVKEGLYDIFKIIF